MNDIQKYKPFELEETLQLITTENDLLKLLITNEHCEAEIYLHGGHLTHYQPKGEAAIIFDAKESKITPPKSVHAGIPICWPWFGPHPTDNSKPQHGFARDSVWELKSARALKDDETEVVLVLIDDNTTLTLFAHQFRLELTFHIGKKLSISLHTINTDKNAFTITQALHTYFAISDIDTVQIEGVEQTPFIDYTDERSEKVETEPLQIREETNRVYIPTTATCSIIDNQFKRTIIIEKSGSHSTTIWNPWENSAIHDLPDDKYRKFVCIETTNALEDRRTLQPGESHTISQTISTVAL